MPLNINPAFRVARLLDKAASQQGHLKPLEVWGRVFEFGDKYSLYTFEIVKMMGLLYDEVLLTLAKMQATDYSDHLYTEAINNAREALDVGALESSQWSSKEHLLSIQTRQALHFCAELLPDEEEFILDTELEQLWEQLQALRTAVVDSSVPGQVKTFVLEQIGIIEQAIRNYPIIGIRAFRSALPEGVASFIENREMVRNVLDAEDVDKEVREEVQEQLTILRRIWGQVQSVAEKTGPILTIVNAVQKALELTGQ
jgi:hypothetical protein